MRKFLVFALCVALGTASAGATLVPTSSPVGAGVVDTSTGLEWLTMPPTRGALCCSTGDSVDDILGGAGGILAAGFRFATVSQVAQLFADAGIVSFDVDAAWQTASYSSLNAAGASLLVTDFGNVNAGSGGDGITLVQGYAVSGGSYYAPWVGYNGSAGAASCLTADAPCQVTDLTGHYSVGAFLVEAVPEPASFVLLISGLGSVLLVRRLLPKPALAA